MQAILVGSHYSIMTRQNAYANAAMRYENLFIWHRRFGHIGLSLIVNALNKDAATEAHKGQDKAFFTDYVRLKSHKNASQAD